MYEFFQKPVAAVVGLLVLLLVVAGAVGWHGYTSPKRVFDDMLVNNLTTSAVTKSTISTTSTTASLQQANLQLGGTDATRWLVTIEQKSGSVTTESIGTKGAGYVRYLNIAGAQKSANYTSLLNVWAKAGKSDTDTSLSKLFSQTMLDVSAAPAPPIGNINPSDRAEILTYIKNEDVFTPDYGKVKTAQINGRKVYEYGVAVKLAPYLRMMQAFAHTYGLKDLDAVNPSDYQSVQPVTISVSVDVLSHQMARVTYATNGFSETYSDYGIARPIQLPTHTISTAELQKRLTAAQ